MNEAISQFFTSVFGDNVFLATFLIAMIPLVELRGAIPFGMSVEFWGERALSSWQALGAAFLGGTVVSVLFALVLQPLVKWLSKYKPFRAFINFLTFDVRRKSEKINRIQENEQLQSKLATMFSVCVFVAFPVPLTGVWTGTILGKFCNLNFWQVFVATTLGNFVCGLIVIFICNIFAGSATIILYIFLGLLAVTLVLKIVTYICNQKAIKKAKIDAG